MMCLSFIAPISTNAFQVPQAKEKKHAHELYATSSPNREGHLAVSDKHSIFYATYGNPEGIPVVVLHGGPCAGCNDTMSKFFDPKEWHVIMFDQRGAMRSTPFGCMEENTPQYSIDDMEMLREHLGVDKWVLFGGSWGTTLATLYGQQHPERCLGFILRGVFLGREPDYLHLIYGMGKIFPEPYDAFVQHIPKEEQNDLLTAYYKRVMDADPEIHMPAARAFTQYDFTCATHLPNPEMVESVVNNDAMTLGIARAFFYYSYHHFFLEPNQILDNMEKIAHIPAVIVHGRWDAICLPEMAYLLHKNWPNSALWLIPDGGHSGGDRTISQALACAADLFIEELKQERKELAH